MISYNVYIAGTRNAESLVGNFPDFAAAMAAYEANPLAWAIVPVGEAGELEAFGPLDSIVPRYGLGRHGSGVYVSRCGDGFTTLGFAHTAGQVAKVGLWLETVGKPLEGKEPEPGTPEAFARYHAAMAAGAAHNRETGARCTRDLTPELIGLEGKRVEVVDCHGETRRFWVGKSSGWLPIHLEIERRNSSGGCGVYGAPFKSVREVR